MKKGFYLTILVIILIIVGLLGFNNKFKDKDIDKDKNNNLDINDKDIIPSDYLDDGIFSDYYEDAYNKLKSLSVEDKIGQLFLVRYPDNNAINDVKEYKLGGFVFFGKDFKNKTLEEVKKMIKEVQEVSNIPLLTAVDEEGGIVVRVSSNSNLSNERFKSPHELYELGGFDKIKEDTINKSKVLSNLGLNLNLAPVVDVCTNSTDYMYDRSLGMNSDLTSTYAKTVVEASKGTGVSYTLKHFPGYGNNVDTHTGSSIDNRTYDDIMNNDIKPFKSGIDSGAEAILVSHNIVSSIDNDNPASISINIHNILRENLDFTGIIITDDLEMGAVSEIDDAVIKAIKAGNNLIITTDYKSDIDKVKKSIKDGTLSEKEIDKLVFKVLAWKYYKELL